MASIRTQLEQNGPLLGLCVMYPSPGVIERIGPDWDWIWIDGQHGELDYADQLALVRACNFVDRPALVRVPGHDFGTIGKALDSAPAGVIVPCVDTPDQARAVVDAAKFPPFGKRSYGGRRPIDLWGRGYSNAANAESLLICQIESPEAVENAEAIAAIEGVDGLFLGPDDLGLRRGFSMSDARPKDALMADMQAVVDAFSKHDKLGVMVGANEEMLTTCKSMGFHLIVVGGDVSFLATMSRTQSDAARKTLRSLSTEKQKPAAAEHNSPY